MFVADHITGCYDVNVESHGFHMSTEKFGGTSGRHGVYLNLLARNAQLHVRIPTKFVNHGRFVRLIQRRFHNRHGLSVPVIINLFFIVWGLKIKPANIWWYFSRTSHCCHTSIFNLLSSKTRLNSKASTSASVESKSNHTPGSLAFSSLYSRPWLE